MAAGAWQFTNAGRQFFFNGTFDIDSDTFKMAIFLSTSNIGAGSTTYAGLTNEHAEHVRFVPASDLVKDDRLRRRLVHGVPEPVLDIDEDVFQSFIRRDDLRFRQ